MERYVKKIKAFIDIGNSLQCLSTCKRLKVSAIVFPADCTAVLSIGYNSPPRSIPNDNCTNEPGECGCVHAEANALIKLNLDLKVPCFMYSRTMPCIRCASMILNCSHIRAVIWERPYRNNLGHDLLNSAAMTLVQVDELESRITLLKYWKSQC